MWGSVRSWSVRIGVATLVLAAAVPLRALDPAAVEAWRSDLELARREIPEKHADAFHHLAAARFNDMVDELERRLPDLSVHQAEASLSELVAAIGDGHTRMTLPLAEGVEFFQGHSSTAPPADPALLFHAYPLRLGIYEEGVFVERIGSQWAALAGSKLLAIDGHPIAEVEAALAPTISHDNDLQLLDLLPERLVLAELLQVRGIVSDAGQASFLLELPGGRQEIVVLAPQSSEAPVVWADARPEVSRRPLSARFLTGPSPMSGELRRNYWLEWLPERRIMYVQLNASLDQGDESLYAFADRLGEALEALPVSRLVVDLRWNRGGDGTLNRHLLHVIIGARKINRPGAIFVLVGRRTFSAGMMLAVDMEQHTHAVFAGEPTGAFPNHYGDSRKLTLPRTGLTLRISSLYWQLSDPRDHRDAITPQISVPPRWSDWTEGRDAALNAVMAPPVSEVPTGRWTGIMSPPFQSFPLRLDLERREGRLVGRLDAGPLGSGIDLEEIQSAEGLIRISAKTDAGDVQLEARRLGDRLAGEVVLDGRRGSAFPFALERVIEKVDVQAWEKSTGW